jgi:hypothetical protein
MARFPLRAIDGPAGNGFELDGRSIFWQHDDPQPVMTVPCAEGGKASTRVKNPAFEVPVGAPKRRTLQKAAALAFFAPLLPAEAGR